MTMNHVGEFTLNDGILSGPADYMREQGNALVDAMLDGKDLIFNTTSHLSPTIEMAILIRLQTDHAGWVGIKQVEGWLTHAAKAH
jgi:hypothetical protein